MATEKKHILIIDDHLHQERGFEEFRKKFRDAEVVLVDNSNDALKQLQAWSDRNIRADIIALDDTLDSEGRSIDGALKKLAAWLQRSGEAVPIVYQTKDPEGVADLFHLRVLKGEIRQSDVPPVIADTQEWLDMIGGKFGQGTGGAVTHVLKDHILTLVPDDVKRIAAAKAERALDAANLTPEMLYPMAVNSRSALALLPRLNVEPDFFDKFSPQADVSNAVGKPFDNFAQHRGPDVTGKAAFNKEQVEQILSRHQVPVVFHDDFSSLQNSHISHGGGNVILGASIPHLNQFADYHGITVMAGGNTHGVIESDEQGMRYVSREHGAEKLSIRPGDDVTIAGNRLYAAHLPVKESALRAEMEQVDFLMRADLLARAEQGKRELEIQAIAETPKKIKDAIGDYAKGIGLMRTELMMTGQGRLPLLREAILTKDSDRREECLAALGKAQEEDMRLNFEAANLANQHRELAGKFPITVRLLDAAPDKIFGTENPTEVEALLKERFGKRDIRGVELAARVPGLYAMQMKAILKAAQETGFTDHDKLNIMIPLVRSHIEVKRVRKELDEVAREVERETGRKVPYRLSVMDETRGAIVNAKEISGFVDGTKSIGGKDLTIAITGLHPEEYERISHWTAEHKGECEGKDPFFTLAKTVKHSIARDVRLSRSAKPDIHMAFCGDQVARDPDSIKFCYDAGLNSISVPVDAILPARIIAAKAAVESDIAEAKQPQKKEGYGFAEALDNELLKHQTARHH